jgi:hypothetical protein
MTLILLLIERGKGNKKIKKNNNVLGSKNIFIGLMWYFCVCVYLFSKNWYLYFEYHRFFFVKSLIKKEMGMQVVWFIWVTES